MSTANEYHYEISPLRLNLHACADVGVRAEL